MRSQNPNNIISFRVYINRPRFQTSTPQAAIKGIRKTHVPNLNDFFFQSHRHRHADRKRRFMPF